MRIELAVLYEDRETVKKLGAKWDAGRRTWYVQNADDLAPFLPWIKHPHLRAPTKNEPSAGNLAAQLAHLLTGDMDP